MNRNTLRIILPLALVSLLIVVVVVTLLISVVSRISGSTSGWGWLVWVFGFMALGAITYPLWPRLKPLFQTPETQEEKDERNAVLWILIIAGILALLFIFFSPLDFPKLFWGGVIALLVMSCFYKKWDKVFTGNKGKKTVHAVLAGFVVFAVVTVVVPKELWIRYVGFNPLDLIKVKDSERAAEKARELLASQEDKAITKEIDAVIAKIKDGKRPNSGEQALIKECQEKNEHQKCFVLHKDEWTNVSKESGRARIFPLSDGCIQGRLGGELLPMLGKCTATGAVKSDKPRLDTNDLELTSLSGKVEFVKVVYTDK